MPRLRLHVVACSTFRPELELLAPIARCDVTVEHLEMGLHTRASGALHVLLQRTINGAEGCDAVAVGYGLCNRAVLGLQARTVPVVIPRAHDCIGMLLGDSQRYLAELERHPGTYFQSAGWLENAPPEGDVRQPDFTFGPNSNVTYDRLVERYGQENADYLLGQFDDMIRSYSRLAYIATGAATHWEASARKIAAARNWSFARLEGDTGWIKRLVDGEWDPREFLIVRPGEHVVAAADERLIDAESA